MNALAWTVLLAVAQDPKTDLTELPLEELLRIRIDEVYSASRFVQKLRQAPANASVVTAEEIRRLGYRTIGDALQATRGAYVTSDRNYSYLGVRGFGLPADYNNRVLFMVDGHRVNDNVYGANYPGREFPVDIDMVDRIEFVRGPASSLYGSNAFFGVVNVMTRKGSQLGGGELSAGAGSFDAYEGRASWGRRLEDGPEIVLSGSAYGAKGETLYYPEFDDPATGNGVARNADAERAGKVLGTASWKGFTLQGVWSERFKEIPTASFGGSFPSDATSTSDQFAYATLSYERTFDEVLDVLARASYNRYWYRGLYEGDDGLGGRVLNKDSALGYWWGTELLVTRRFHDDRLKLSAGGEYRNDFRQDQDNHDDFGTHVNVQESSRVAALFAQADARPLDELRIHAGLRWDDYSTFGGTLNPRAALVWSPAEGTTFKALYGRAFRAPSAYEMGYATPTLQKSNPDLEPETIETYELSAEQDLAEGLSAFVSGYSYDGEDLITLEVDPSDGLRVFRNVAEVHAHGVETELRLDLDGVRATASYSYHEARYVGPDRHLTNSPHHLAKLAVIAPLPLDGVYLGAELQYMSERRTPSGGTTDDVWLVNLTLTATELAKGLDLSVSLYNLFDEEYFDPGSSDHVQDQLEREGLAFRVKLTWRF